jgi:hypothetical protein
MEQRLLIGMMFLLYSYPSAAPALLVLCVEMMAYRMPCDEK